MHNKTLKIGITGGIGSGKTTICKIFEHFNIPVYYSDQKAKKLLNSNKEVIKNIKECFGWESYNEKGNLDRNYLAKIVFNNQQKLNLLNSIVHPPLFEDYRKWVIANKKYPYTLKEAALMFETSSYKELDKIVVVTAPINTRINRVVKRDNVRKEDVLKRMENQLSDREKIAKADYIIKNDGKNSLIIQVLKLHKMFLEMAKNKN
ncbi:MAG: dephospho-CoA kinase [Bacteroidetes bacterium]|nr:dephospho-CoA kinase [Bacteroidota bacterium]